MIATKNNAADIVCYTSYFGMLCKLPSNVVPVCITRHKPRWYDGLCCQSLRPSQLILDAYRINQITQDEYKHMYTQQVLLRLCPARIMNKLQRLVGSGCTPALMCYEKSGQFCHRHIVSDWLTAYGLPCIEWQPQELI